jgi:hypothetical protein
MSFNEKTLDELHAELARIRREQEIKGPNHPEYKHAEAAIPAIQKAVEKKQQEV